MSGRVIRVGVWAVAVLLLAASHAFGQAFPRGRVTGSVVSRANPEQHYAVYVPTSFDGSRPVPVLFIMDYRGRARSAVEVFRPAAERFGWILMSSNHTASDEAPEPSLEALKAMWTDAHDLFPVDTRRLYLAGLSGTARTATWLATQLPGSIAGIIGAAAGFAPGVEPTRDTKFLYFGTAGDADYNYWEMRELERRLAELELPGRIEFFSGSHGWMPPNLAMAAIEWLELRAMRSQLTPVVPAFVEEQWREDILGVEIREEAGRPAGASRRLLAIARDYDGLRPARDIGMIKAWSDRLAKEPRHPAEIEAEKTAAAAHAKRIADAMRMIAAAYPPAASAPAQPLARTLTDLGVQDLVLAAASRDPNAALDARRVLAELDVQTGFYLPVEAMRAGDDDRAAYYLDIAKVITPEDPYAWFLRARISARAGRPSEAIAALVRAVRLGFRTLNTMQHDHAFDALRAHPEFRRLVDQVRAAWESGLSRRRN